MPVQTLTTTTENTKTKTLNLNGVSNGDYNNGIDINYLPDTEFNKKLNSSAVEKNIYFDKNENIYYKKVNEEQSNSLIDEDIQQISNKKIQSNNKKESTIKSLFNFQTELIWLNIVSIIGFHVFAVYTLTTYSFFDFPKSLYTIGWAIITGGLAGFGVTAGAHRLWSHRAYKAKLPLRIILMLCYAMAGQNRLFDWIRDHRVHHKFSETDADPHNANRGFFFAHVGWLMMRKHPEVLRKGKQIDMSDILEDPVIQFFERYFHATKFLVCFIIPSLVPIYGWNESLFFAACSQGVIRYVMSLNFTWLVNSAAHIWGSKPYDRRIGPVENISVAIVAMGEGWHNYHHVFPWDYKAAELGNYRVNITTFWLDLFAKIGWAYDLKTPSKELVQKVIEKTGDGTHPYFGDQEISENEDKWRKTN